MRIISGYTITEHISESSRSLVYRAYRQSDKRRVILKLLKKTYPSPKRIAWFRREYEITLKLDLEGVVRAYSMETDQQQWLMVLEDFGGDSLKQLNLAGTMPLTELIDLAINVVDILGQIHEQHIIHKDINPSNMVYNPVNREVKIIDFGIATVLSRENPSFCNPHIIEGTRAYTSPEQTGRVNRAIDYRSDFYSFGVTLYELLTGRLPFESQQPLALVHDHIAKEPIPPHTLLEQDDSPDDAEYRFVLESISAIIVKLMAKNADHRYQSAYGLHKDLEHCLHISQNIDARKRHRIATPANFVVPKTFIPGIYDLSDRFYIPQKLYGREEEQATLLGIFEHAVAQNTNNEMVLVTGPSGIGKSALVHELYTPITLKHGYFIAGKFEQYQHETPYVAFVQALRSLMQHILSDTEETITHWREQLCNALGNNGTIIIDVIPEIAPIIGNQSTEAEFLPIDAEHHFHAIFQKFIEVCSSLVSPLVIFLDDLQWADRASLKLVTRMMTNQPMQQGGMLSSSPTDATKGHALLLLVGAYRDNEVAPPHPLMQSIHSIKQAGVSIHTLALHQLNTAAITHIVADSFHKSETEAQPLAELIKTKTQGNPFFINTFLKTLYLEGLINFRGVGGIVAPSPTRDNIPHTTSPNLSLPVPGWYWDIERIQQRQMTDNVVELLATKVQNLSPQTRTVLRIAACMGNQFDLVTLSVACEQTVSQTANALIPAIEEGLIIPLSDTYKIMVFDVPGLADEITAEYMFAHDRIQQAVYALIPEKERHIVHWHIALLLLHTISPNMREPHIFALAHQIKQGLPVGLPQIKQESPKTQQPESMPLPTIDELATIYLQAGRKARTSAAYETAFDYLQTGISLINESFPPQESASSDTISPWQSNYALALSLYTETLEAEYMNASFEQAETTANYILANATSLYDKIPVYERQIQIAMFQIQMKKAIAIGQNVLNELGIVLIQNPPDVADIEALEQLPYLTDPKILAALRILMHILSPAFVVDQALLPQIVFTMAHLCVGFGNSPIAAFAYGFYAVFLCSPLQQIENGYRYGMLARKLADHYATPDIATRVDILFNGQIRYWKEHARESIEPCLDALYTAQEHGDIEYLGYAAVHYCNHLLFVGEPLDSVIERSKPIIALLQKLKQEYLINQPQICQQIAYNLQGMPEQMAILQGVAFDETIMESQLQESHNESVLCFLYLAKTILFYLGGDNANAIIYARKADSYRSAVTGLIIASEQVFYAALAILAHYDCMDTDEQQQALVNVATYQEMLHTWAHHAPMNFQHKYILVEAERARVLGHYGDAREYYDQAIALADTHGYLHEYALANELAGAWYWSRNSYRVAPIYLQDAHHAYIRWGATAKVRHLETQYPEIFTRFESKTDESTPIHIETTPVITETQATSMLDLASVIKAAQAFSSEMVLSNLLSQVLHVMIENAGAQKGILLLYQSGEWVIEATGRVDQESVQVLQSIPIENNSTQAPILPLSIVNYVARTMKHVVLHDSKQEEQFANDAYIQQQLSCSILCLPLVHQGKLVGILYLENKSIVGAFTEDRLEILNVLASQAAISLQNAFLYSTMEDRIEERTRELVQSNQALQDEVVERERTATALSKSEATYRAMFERNRAVKLLIDPKTSKIVDANPAASEFYGYPLEKLCTLKISDINTLNPQQISDEMKLANNERRSYFLFRHRIASGGVRDVEVHSGPIEVHGRNLLLSIVHDITDRVQAQRELKQHDSIFEALGTSAQHFLRTDNIHNEMPLFLELVGIATGVSRVVLFVAEQNEYGTPIFKQREVWISAGQKSIFLEVQRKLNAGKSNEGFTRNFVRWNLELCQGKPIYGNVQSFPNEEQRILAVEQIRSLIAVPIFVEHEWWGFLEFDLCNEERKWSMAERKALETAASMMGAAIEREQVQGYLRENEERLRTVAEFTYDWEYWMGPHGTFLYVSPSCERITGYHPEAFQANPNLLQEIIHPQDQVDCVLKVLVPFSEEEEEGVCSTEFRILTRDGKERWLGHVSQSVYASDGRYLGRRASNRDITERVVAEQALRSGEARYRVISELVSDYAYAMLVDANTSYTLEWVTEAFTRTTGFAPDEVDTDNLWLSLVDEQDRTVLRQRNIRLLNGLVDVCEFRIHTRSGDIRWVREHTRPEWSDAEQRVIRIYGAARDITERKEAAELLRKSHDELEERVTERTAILRQTEQELRHVNQALKTLSECNQALVRATDEQELFQSICNIIVHAGGYRMAWVGFVGNGEPHTLSPLAIAGYEEHNVSLEQLTWSKNVETDSPVVAALRSCQPIIVRNVLDDATFPIWGDEALAQGYGAAVVLPLSTQAHVAHESSVLGTLAIYARDTSSFDRSEIEYLEKLCNDLVYGMMALRIRDEYRKTAARLSNILDIAASAIIAVDDQHCIQLFNPAAELIFGYESHEVLGKPFKLLLMPLSIAVYEAYVRDITTKDHDVVSGTYCEVVARRRYGSSFPAEISIASSHQRGHEAFTIIVHDVTAQKQAEEELIESRDRIANILESITDGFFSLNEDWRFVYINHEAERLLGKSREELWEQNIWEIFPEAIESDFYPMYQKAFTEQVSVTFETLFNPWLVWFEVHAYPSREGLSIYFRDISERKRAERELQRVNRALKTLSESNKVVVRATSEEELLDNICQNLVHIGGYRMAWVGYALRENGKQVQPVAQAGYNEGYLEHLHITWDDSDLGKGPTGTAIRTGQVSVIRNIQTDPRFVLWRSDAIERGYVSSIALPIKMIDKSGTAGLIQSGALSIYASEPDAFDAAEIELLTELADDLAYGITAIRIREQHRRIEEQLRYQKTLLECQSEASFDGVLVVHNDRKTISYNQRFVDIWGTSRDKIAHFTGNDLLDYIKDYVVHSDQFIKKIMRLYENPHETSWDEVVMNDGRTFERYSAPVIDAEDKYYGRVWFYRDITERNNIFKQLQVAHERLQMLSRRMVEVQETERRTIARELHDEVGQSLTGLHLLLSMISRATTIEQAQAKLSEAQSLVNQLMSQVRELSLDLRPAMLDDLGLLPTLRWHFQRYTSQTNIRVIFKHDGIDRRFETDIETVVYRIIQEALTNVARYARVEEVTVRLWSDQDTMGLQIEDQGVGFDTDIALEGNASSGLAGMQERVSLLGGSLDIESALGNGTCLFGEIPFR